MKPVTLDDIESVIVSEHYGTGDNLNDIEVFNNGTNTEDVHPSLGLMTFCVLVTKNGHTVTGESYCQNPAMFNAVTGRQWARKAAIDKLWPMVVYARREAAKPNQKTIATRLEMAKKMADRLMGWKLPKDFSPDCGISFDGRKDDEWNKNKTWPVGTNMLSHEQAVAMLLEIMPADIDPEAATDTQDAS